MLPMWLGVVKHLAGMCEICGSLTWDLRETG